MEKMHSTLKCIICGTPLYNTDKCLSELSYHCSSAAARFWDCDRGSIEETNAKNHWDQSRIEITNSGDKNA
jgi:hypothetical protein